MPTARPSSVARAAIRAATSFPTWLPAAPARPTGAGPADADSDGGTSGSDTDSEGTPSEHTDGTVAPKRPRVLGSGAMAALLTADDASASKSAKDKKKKSKKEKKHRHHKRAHHREVKDTIGQGAAIAHRILLARVFCAYATLCC